jgi:hypothetical protein
MLSNNLQVFTKQVRTQNEHTFMQLVVSGRESASINAGTAQTAQLTALGEHSQHDCVFLLNILALSSAFLPIPR